MRLPTAFLLALTLALGSSTASAISGIEGTFEFAFDAPWRIEPVVEENGRTSYGRIPIQLTIHDAWFADLDDEPTRYTTTSSNHVVPVHPPGPPQLGSFCDVEVIRHLPTGASSSALYEFGALAEVERTFGFWVTEDSENPEPPPHEVCRQEQGQSCPHLRTIRPSTEWFGLLWHPVPEDALPGDVLELEIRMRVVRDPDLPCAVATADDELLLVNHVRVALAADPLPRFEGDWLYGDLHYHSQGTDNEGEAGHSYRGVVRAMGAMGLDFAFATEHASNSPQIVDGDLLDDWSINNEHTGGDGFDVLRDMSDSRFRFLFEHLNGEGGVNPQAATRGPFGSPSQLERSVGRAPRLFLGGEIDAVPEVEGVYISEDDPHLYDPEEIAALFAAYGYTQQGVSYFALQHPDPFVRFARDESFEIDKLCGGEIPLIPTQCSPWRLLEPSGDGAYLLQDLQGMNDLDYFGRAHLVYLPREEAGADAFVASNTSRYGGATRRLARSHDGQGSLLADIEPHGYVFLAHPFGAGGGSKGPNGAPWTDHMLRQAFRSPAVLGLQLWNEDTRSKRELSPDDDEGYTRPPGILGAFDERPPIDGLRDGFYDGRFELHARGWPGFGRDRNASLATGLNRGTWVWDRMNLWGLDPSETASLRWLVAGQPRRVLMAGGSDAHGDFNYRREGYFQGNTSVTDTAIAKPRNLVRLPRRYPALETTPPVLGEYQAPEESGASALPWTTTALQTSLATSWVAESTSTSPWELDAGSVSTGTVFDASVAVPAPEPEMRSQAEILDALVSGHFSVTDGPALRIVIDTDRDGQIGPGDVPMGGVVDLHGETTLPLLIEWMSTPEFGPVMNVELVVGASGSSGARIYAPPGVGPGAVGGAAESVFDFWQYERDRNGYWRVDAVPLRVFGNGDRTPHWCGGKPGDPDEDPVGLEDCIDDAPPLPEIETSMAQLLAVDLDLVPLRSSRGETASRFFVRAYAETSGPQTRYAYSNPIWAMSRGFDACPEDAAHPIDGDGDGLPDGCDPCPDLHRDEAYSLCMPDQPGELQGPVTGSAGDDEPGPEPEPEAPVAPIWSPLPAFKFSWFGF